MIYCLVKSGAPTDQNRNFDGDPPDVSHKNLVWMPYTRVPDPAFDPRTHRILPPQKAIQGDNVVESRAVIALTQQEIDDRDDAEVTSAVAVIKPLIMALNDGSFAPASNYTNAQLRQIIKDHR